MERKKSQSSCFPWVTSKAKVSGVEIKTNCVFYNMCWAIVECKYIYIFVGLLSSTEIEHMYKYNICRIVHYDKRWCEQFHCSVNTGGSNITTDKVSVQKLKLLERKEKWNRFKTALPAECLTSLAKPVPTSSTIQWNHYWLTILMRGQFSLRPHLLKPRSFIFACTCTPDSTSPLSLTSSSIAVKHGPCLLTPKKRIQALDTQCMRKLLCISYLVHKTNNQMRSKINFLVGPQNLLWQLSRGRNLQ